MQSALTMASLIERQLYPVNAKYHLKTIEHLPVETTCRVKDDAGLTATFQDEVRQMDVLLSEISRRLGISEVRK